GGSGVCARTSASNRSPIVTAGPAARFGLAPFGRQRQDRGIVRRPGRVMARVHQIACPKCGAGMKSKAGIPVGKSVDCPKCKHKFEVAAADEIVDMELVEDTDVVEDAEIVDDAAAKPPPRKKGPPPVPPPLARKKATRTGEVVEPEEDDEDRPRRRLPGEPGGDTRSRRPDHRGAA